MNSPTLKETFRATINQELIEGYTKAFLKHYNEKYLTDLNHEFIKAAYTDTLNQYKRYLKEMNNHLNTIDFYKWNAWFGYFLAMKLNGKKMQYRALDTTLWLFFRKDNSIKVPNEIEAELKALLKNQLDDNDTLGIGKNGLYMIGKIANSITPSN